MYAKSVLRFTHLGLGVALVSPLWAMPGDARAEQMLKVWRAVHEKLHPGIEPPWRGQDDAVAWAKSERDRVEPIVISIIRGEEPGIQWTAGVAMARHIPSPTVCDLILKLSNEIIERAPDRRLAPDSVDERGLINMLDVLAQHRPQAVRPLILEVASHPNQSSLLIEHCLSALRMVGTPEDVPLVQRIASRHLNDDIDRQCAVTEKAIDAQAVGRDMLENAEADLRSLTGRYLHALESEDPKEYIDLHAYGFRRIADEGEVARDVFGNSEMRGMVDALKRVVGREAFEVYPDSLRASLVIDGRYKVIYVFEVEGWRVAGVERIAP